MLHRGFGRSMLYVGYQTLGRMIAMLATSRGCILFGFSFLLFTGASWAQFTAISGDVKDVDGQKLRGAEILIEREGQKGSYKGLPIGKYTVSVIVGGQTRDQISGVATRLGDPTELNFDLKQAADKQLAQAGSTPAQEQARGMSKEERERLDKQAKENAAILAKNKALNDAFNAGKEAMNAKNYDAAVESFQKGVEMDPNQNVIFANLAGAYVGLAATKTGADQQAPLDKALEAYSKAIALKPDN